MCFRAGRRAAAVGALHCDRHHPQRHLLRQLHRHVHRMHGHRPPGPPEKLSIIQTPGKMGIVVQTLGQLAPFKKNRQDITKPIVNSVALAGQDYNKVCSPVLFSRFPPAPRPKLAPPRSSPWPAPSSSLWATTTAPGLLPKPLLRVCPFGALPRSPASCLKYPQGPYCLSITPQVPPSCRQHLEGRPQSHGHHIGHRHRRGELPRISSSPQVLHKSPQGPLPVHQELLKSPQVSQQELCHWPREVLKLWPVVINANSYRLSLPVFHLGQSQCHSDFWPSFS